MADLYNAAGPVVDHDMLDIEGAAREALALAGDAAAVRTPVLSVVYLLPYAASLTADARAAIATRIWTLLEDQAA